MFEAGTRTSSRMSSAVWEARMPILCSILPIEKPGVSASTMKAVMPWYFWSGSTVVKMV